MEITWEPGLVEKANQRKQKEVEEDLTPFDKYLKKKEMKKKERKEALKKKRMGIEEDEVSVWVIKRI